MDTLPEFFHSDPTRYSGDKLPDFTPVDESLKLSQSDIDVIFQPSDPLIAAAEAQCRAGSFSEASASIDQLLDGGTPANSLQACLLEATCSGTVPLVRKLLSVGVPVSVNLMEPAIRHHSLDLLTLLLEFGLDLNKEVEWCIPPPLSLALDVEADETVVKWFLANGADPDARCEMDITPFSIALQYAPLPIVQLLFCHTPTPRNGQLLHHAARRMLQDSSEVIELLLHHCQELHVNDIMYQNHAFSFAVRKCVGLGTPLHEAAATGTPDTVRALLSHGADITALDSLGNTPLEAAQLSKNSAVVELLSQLTIDH